MRTMKLPDLKDLEIYTCPEVILKYARDYRVTEMESRMVFKETMKMLWLMVKHLLDKEENAFNVQKPMVPLDKMWHEFGMILIGLS